MGPVCQTDVNKYCIFCITSTFKDNSDRIRLIYHQVIQNLTAVHIQVIYTVALIQV